MDRKYIVKISTSFTGEQLKVLKRALSQYSRVATEFEKITVDELLEFVTNADERAKRLLKLKNS